MIMTIVIDDDYNDGGDGDDIYDESSSSAQLHGRLS